jgi:hypothetical protein
LSRDGNEECAQLEKRRVDAADKELTLICRRGHRLRRSFR